MMISIRLDEELDRLLRRTAKALGRTRSEVVKASLREYCSRVLSARAAVPYALIEDLLGRAGSGRGDLSTRGRKSLAESLRAKHARPASRPTPSARVRAFTSSRSR
jgi:predicted transcriptional regulator